MPTLAHVKDLAAETKDTLVSLVFHIMATNENADVLFENGRRAYQGHGRQQSSEAAVAYLVPAAKKKHGQACALLGQIYGDPEETHLYKMKMALYYLRRGAEAGDVTAHYLLAQRYAYGAGVEQSTRDAASHYYQAIQQGDQLKANKKLIPTGYNESKMCLAALYLTGDGVNKDTPHAITLYREAAEAGLSEAQIQMGYFSIYPQKYDIDATPDNCLAAQWFRRASVQGDDPLAMGLLAACYKAEDFPLHNPQYARLWLTFASAYGRDFAKEALDTFSLSPIDEKDILRVAQEEGKTWRHFFSQKPPRTESLFFA